MSAPPTPDLVMTVQQPDTGELKRKRIRFRLRAPKPVYWASVTWLVGIAALGLLAPFLPLASYVTAVGPPLVPPFTEWPEFLGTDQLGRSVLSRLLYGARDTMVIAFGATAVGLILGTAIGVLAGYFRGPLDRGLGFVLDVLLAFPPLIVLLILVTVLEPSMGTLLAALGLLAIPTFARLSRASTLVWVDRPFIVAARTYGATDGRIVFKDLLANVVLPLLTLLPIVVSGLIVAEGSLSYLGFGMPPPQPSWGNMIAGGMQYLRTDPALVIVPATAVFLTVFALNTIGERTRSRYELPGAS